MRVLLIDNYDSFTYNVAHLFTAAGAEVTVLRNDAPELTRDEAQGYDLVVIGPGPGRPADAGKTPDIITGSVEGARPMFGICLGLQALGEHFGGEVVNAPSLMHGKTSEITHARDGIFAGIASPFIATRYHSLCVSRAGFPEVLRVTATSSDDVIQALEHVALPISAVQFHPESILTVAGRAIFENVLAAARDTSSVSTRP